MGDENLSIGQPSRNYSIDVQGNVDRSLLNTGNLTLFVVSPDAANNISDTFGEKTSSALRNSQPEIIGLSDVIARPEVGDIEELMRAQQSVMVIGEPGTGKSGICNLLIQNAKLRGQPHLALNCRLLQNLGSEQELRNYLTLGTFTLRQACSALNQHNPNRDEPFLLVIDQFDSVLGTAADDVVFQAAQDCHEQEGICVVVFSRSSESRERSLIEALSNQGFKTISCDELTNATEYLTELGISPVSQELEEVARNLLHLSLIAKIRQQNPSTDFSTVTSAVSLWEQRIKIFNEQHRRQGPDLIAELTYLAEIALKDPRGTFLVGDPPSAKHAPLLSEKLIRRIRDNSDICLFSHEKLQEFLYARKLSRQNKSADFAVRELGQFRAQNVILWLDKIATANKAPEREDLLRTIFNV